MESVLALMFHIHPDPAHLFYCNSGVGIGLEENFSMWVFFHCRWSYSFDGFWVCTRYVTDFVSFVQEEDRCGTCGIQHLMKQRSE